MKLKLRSQSPMFLLWFLMVWVVVVTRYECGGMKSMWIEAQIREFYIEVSDFWLQFKIFHEPLSETHHLGFPGSWICPFIFPSICPIVHSCGVTTTKMLASSCRCFSRYRVYLIKTLNSVHWPQCIRFLESHVSHASCFLIFGITCCHTILYSAFCT